MMETRDAVRRRLTILARAPELALLLDLDGTLIPFASRAEDAYLDRSAIDLLVALGEAGVQIVIISGRPQRLIDPLRAGLERVWWAAEHGTWTCGDDKRWRGPEVAHELATLRDVLAACAQVPGARLESKSQSLCLHWRLTPPELKDQLIAQAELACDEWLEASPEFERIAGVEMLEVRRRSAHKGVAVHWVHQHHPSAPMISIGDDDTDEDMFAALGPSDLALGVGPRRSSRIAGRLADPTDVRALLRWILAVRTTKHEPPLDMFAPPDRTTPTRTNLVVVSNRIPSAVTGGTRSVGGLVSALEPALRAHEGIWLGWSGHETDGERPLVIDTDVRPARASFDFAPGWRESFYGGFCNRALWPLFHGFPSRVRYRDTDWRAYCDANAEFAAHARGLAASGGTIWIHDYHLLLVACELRRRGFTGPLGLFLHIPFPDHDLFDTLPWADQLVDAMLDFDLIGFHTEQWAQNFRACVATRPTHGRTPTIGVLPIGVDPASFAISDSLDREVTRLQTMLGTRRLILGVDRLDYAKGIPERLLAFERLLELAPEWRSRVSFVQISVPSREDVPEYAELRERVETQVGRINGRFGEADWVPVRYLYRAYDRDVLAQLYRAADVALVTPLRDGLNLVAKEFVVAQDPEAPGVLVLSRFAGAAAELVDALLTNPFHPDGLAADLDRALSMSLDERRRRHRNMLAALAGKTPERWAAAFLDRLSGAARSVA